MPLRVQWSAVKKAIEDDLHDVHVIEKDNVWDYFDEAARVEMEKLKARRARKQP